MLTHASFGEIFAANNFANIAPPFEMGQYSHLSIGAAVQFAVTAFRLSMFSLTSAPSQRLWVQKH
ncbi:MAG: hypothetical protein K9G33_14465 [Sneathiella sp.]|nr:hypothetical protein [Sneathiella sp.]